MCFSAGVGAVFTKESLNKNQRVGGKLLSLEEGPLQLAQEPISPGSWGCCQKLSPPPPPHNAPANHAPSALQEKDDLLKGKCEQLEGIFWIIFTEP